MLGIDEQLYENLSPKKMKQLLGDTKELDLPKTKAWKGVDAGAALRWIITLTILIVVWIGWLLPQLDILEDSRSALCGGNLDFVYLIDQVGAPRWTTLPDSEMEDPPTWKSASQDELDEMLLSIQVVENLLEGHVVPMENVSVDCPPVSSSAVMANASLTPSKACWAAETSGPLSTGVFSVRTSASETIDESLEKLNTPCVDMLSLADQNGLLPNLFVIWGFIADAIVADGNAETCPGGCSRYTPICDKGVCIRPDCAFVAPHCNKPSVLGIRTRMWCPVTCGCREPTSSQILTGPGLGCGQTCAKSQPYRGATLAAPCADATTSKMQAYVAELDYIIKGGTWPAAIASRAGTVLYLLSTIGCPAAAMAQFRPLGLCLDQGPFGLPIKPLTLVCPVSCGCQSTTIPAPLTCLQSCLP